MKNLENKLLKEVKQQYKHIVEKPFIVSVLGQTGVGKSSLINALFDKQLPTHPVNPCTKSEDKVEIVNQKGFKLWFYDLPGLGESDESDNIYLEKYIEQIRISDIILWAINIDNRSVTLDSNTLRKIMSRLELEEQKKFINSITFVLTKADMLFQPPWVFAFDRQERGFFTIGKELKNIFEQKCDYWQGELIEPYKDLIVNATFNDNNFSVHIPEIFFDEKNVVYKGIMSKSYMEALCNSYPEYRKIFQRLYSNYRPVYCSSLFKFNLSKVLYLISNKMGAEASIKIGNFLNLPEIDCLPLSEVRSFSNLIIFNQDEKQIIFDLNTLKI